MLYNLFNIQIKTIFFSRGRFWEKVCEDCINIQLLPGLSVTQQPTKTTFFCCTHRAEPNEHIFKDSSHFKGGSGISLRILDKLPGICQSCQQFFNWPLFLNATRLFSKNSWVICIGHGLSTLESSTGRLMLIQRDWSRFFVFFNLFLLTIFTTSSFPSILKATKITLTALSCSNWMLNSFKIVPL